MITTAVTLARKHVTIRDVGLSRANARRKFTAAVYVRTAVPRARARARTSARRDEAEDDARNEFSAGAKNERAKARKRYGVTTSFYAS